MFSNLSSSSISLATVTPSLVMRGAPNDFSSTTLRPFGPSVTFTALARTSTPRSIFSRASTENLTSLAAMVLLPYDTILVHIGQVFLWQVFLWQVFLWQVFLWQVFLWQVFLGRVFLITIGERLEESQPSVDRLPAAVCD